MKFIDVNVTEGSIERIVDVNNERANTSAPAYSYFAIYSSLNIIRTTKYHVYDSH